jgi:hypothetical protein
MWVACVALYALAATSTSSWTSLVTGYWYNDKVRLASLAAVPGVVLVAAAAPAVRALLRKVPLLGARPVVVALLAVLVIPVLTLGVNGGTRNTLLAGFFRPDEPDRVILSSAAQDSLHRLAALVPAGQGVVGRPENGSPLMWALFGTNTLYRTIPILATDIRWAIDSSHVYWLDVPERSSGLKDLAKVDGVEAVRTDGDYTLYRVTGCGLGGTPSS